MVPEQDSFDPNDIPFTDAQLSLIAKIRTMDANPIFVKISDCQTASRFSRHLFNDNKATPLRTTTLSITDYIHVGDDAMVEEIDRKLSCNDWLILYIRMSIFPASFPRLLEFILKEEFDEPKIIVLTDDRVFSGLPEEVKRLFIENQLVDIAALFTSQDTKAMLRSFLQQLLSES